MAAWLDGDRGGPATRASALADRAVRAPWARVAPTSTPAGSALRAAARMMAATAPAEKRNVREITEMIRAVGRMFEAIAELRAVQARAAQAQAAATASQVLLQSLNHYPGDVQTQDYRRSWTWSGSPSPRHRPRPEHQHALPPAAAAVPEYARPGDTPVVWRRDRLGRSLRELVDLVEQLRRREVALRSLRYGITTETTSAAGRLQLHLFAAPTEHDRDPIKERTAAGMASAAQRGRRGGRPVVKTAAKLNPARRMRDAGDSLTAIAEALDVAETTVRRHLEDQPHQAAVPDGHAQPAA